MFNVAFWSVASILAVAFLAAMVWLLWLQAKRLMAHSARASEAISQTLSAGKTREELTEAGVVTSPRDVDAFADSEQIAQLKYERFVRHSGKEARKRASHEKAYARWASFNK